jgi:lysyl-tRNA synthetase class I
LPYVWMGLEVEDKNHENYSECMEALREITKEYSAIDIFDEGLIAYEFEEPLHQAVKEIKAVWQKYGFEGKDVYIFTEPICTECGHRARSFDDNFCSNCGSRLPALTIID